MTQPFYTPDLAPCDFWLFPKLKSSFKGNRFQTGDENQEKYNRAADGDWENCVRLQGDCFEGDWRVIGPYTMFLVFFIFFNKCLHFSYYVAGYLLWTDLVCQYFSSVCCRWNSPAPGRALPGPPVIARFLWNGIKSLSPNHVFPFLRRAPSVLFINIIILVVQMRTLGHSDVDYEFLRATLKEDHLTFFLLSLCVGTMYLHTCIAHPHTCTHVRGWSLQK